MNSTQLLLLGLLVWFAMSNKSKDTRNVILVVTGILFFCMMNGKEGFTMNRSQLEVTFPTGPDLAIDTPAGDGNVATYRVGDIIFEGDGPWDMSTIENIRCQDPNQTPTLPAGVRVVVDPRVPSDISRFFTCEVPPDVDCAGTWSPCTAECRRTWASSAEQSGSGAACPEAPACEAGQDDCPLDVDCAGSWSPCTAECRRTWASSAEQSGSGAACPEAPACEAGQDDCPLDVDCAGSWSACTEACESASERVWAELRAQSGSGAACPPAQHCAKGEGDCPADMNKLNDDGTTKTCPSGTGIHKEQRCLGAGLDLGGVWKDRKICKGWTHCDDDPSARPLENSDTAT